MHKHKIAMVGAFAVGKTSLVQRYVTGIFSDRYQTTIGVRIDRRQVHVDGRDVLLMLWDLQGEDDVHTVPFNHLRGSSGLLVVADGTRPQTLDTALRLRREAVAMLGDVPTRLLLNKVDLEDQWRLDDARLEPLRRQGLVMARTSARTGDRVAETFEELARAVLA
ncbi:MAG: GTP-binding protein [Planctomycetes bacterium]|nr:GTP-binding protein [Planctomycetota bacterium]